MTNESPIIFIVDDNPTNISVLFEYLEESGFEVAVAQSGEEALEQLHHVQPDLILLDIMMPGINGFETCRRLKKDKSTKDLPVIFMTALTDEIDKVKGFLAGGVDYITKPLHHEEVLVRVNAHLNIRTLQQQVQSQQTLLEEQNKRIEQKDDQLSALRVREHVLFACISHDVQSSLNSVIGTARFLQENWDRTRQQEMQDNLVELRDSAERLSTLHENLLLWGNFHRGSLDFVPQPINLDEIAAYNVVLFTPSAEHKQIVLTSSIQENTVAYADYNMVNAAIRNLIAKGLEFTAIGGKVNVLVKAAEEHVVVSVSTTGSGLSGENLLHRFQLIESCARGDEGKKQKFDVELLLCKEIIEKNGGKMWAERETLHGTILRITLPRIGLAVPGISFIPSTKK